MEEITEKVTEIAIHDIYTAAYLDYKNIPIRIIKKDNRAIFMVPDKPETYRAMTEFNSNPTLPILDYTTCVKKMRAKMIAMRG